MNKVLIAIEWEKYLYLYKYNRCFIAQSNLIEVDASQLQDENKEINKYTISALEKALPIFERDMDVVILEYDKVCLSFESGIHLSFAGILKIIPLSNEAQKMLSTRVAEGIEISKPIAVDLLQRVIEERNRIQRKQAVDYLMKIYNIHTPQSGNEFTKIIHSGLNKIEFPNSSIDKSRILYNVLTFDVTPSFIPEGNIESIIKLGCIVYKAKGKNIEPIKEGYFFKACKRNENEINSGSILDGYLAYSKMIEKLSSPESDAINRLNSEIERDFTYIKSLLVFYIYLSLNRKLAKQNFNIQYVHNDLMQLSSYDAESLFYALAIFGSVHSFENLYESIHRLSGAPLFGSVPNESNEQKANFLASNSKLDVEPNVKTDQTIESNAAQDRASKAPNTDSEEQAPESFNNDKDRVDEKAKPELDKAHQNEESDIPKNPNVSAEASSDLTPEDVIHRIETELKFSKSEISYWETAKSRIINLDEINLFTLLSVLNTEPFITEKGNERTIAKKIRKAIHESYEK